MTQRVAAMKVVEDIVRDSVRVALHARGETSLIKVGSRCGKNSRESTGLMIQV